MLRPDMRRLFASCAQSFTWACLPRLNITRTNCASLKPASPSRKKSSRIVINSEAGRRIIVLVATSEGMVVAGPSREGLAFLLLPAGPAVVLVAGYALFGLPSARRPAWGAEAAPALSSLGYRAGPPLSVNFGMPLSCDLCVYLSFMGGRALLSF